MTSAARKSPFSRAYHHAEEGISWLSYTLPVTASPSYATNSCWDVLQTHLQTLYYSPSLLLNSLMFSSTATVLTSV